MTLNSALGIGKLSMSVAQTGQQTTGHNIANVDTEGFSRQDMQQTTNGPAVAGHGGGSKVQTVRRIQDGFTKEKVVGEQNEVGTWNTREKILTEAEAIFTDLEGKKLRNALDEFWGSWGTLAHEPESGPMRKALLTRSKALTERFQLYDKRLSGVRDTINAKLSSHVLQVNQITEQIARLNKQVEQLENRGRVANDARDQREALLQNLSELVEVRSFENERSNLEVQIKDGQSLVHGRKSYEMIGTKSAEDLNDVQLGLRGPNGEIIDVTGDITGGIMRELVDQRDGNIRKFHQGINEMAKELVFRVNAIHSGGTGLKGVKNSETSAYSLNEDAQKNPLPFLKAGDFKFHMLDSEGAITDTLLVNVDPGKDTVKSIVEKINRAAGAYEKDDKGVETLKEVTPFKATLDPEGSVSLQSDMGTNFTFAGDTSNFFAVMGFNSFFHSLDGARDIKVNQELVEDEMKIAVGSDLVPSDNRIGVAIGDLQRQAVLSDGTMSFDEFYNGQTTEIGLLVQDAQKGAKSHGEMLSQYEALRDSISSVNIDEEMANMVKYQRAYESSAKYLSTVDQMTQTVINM
ncbi:MAG: flagellar hook-associated protein FlgK [SAR324 cluster bacterium]|nr:flagellar hook-associated protein FlgK [SAR324 cluster bacterium]